MITSTKLLYVEVYYVFQTLCKMEYFTCTVLVTTWNESMQKIKKTLHYNINQISISTIWLLLLKTSVFEQCEFKNIIMVAITCTVLIIRKIQYY